MPFWDGSRWIPDGPPPAWLRPRAMPSNARVLGTLAVIVAFVFTGIVGLGGRPGSATAADGVMWLLPESGAAGSTATAHGVGFKPRTRVQLTWDGAGAGMPSGVTDQVGDVTLEFQVPAAAVGPHAVGLARLTGHRDELASVTFNIVPASEPTPSFGTVAPATAAPAPSAGDGDGPPSVGPSSTPAGTDPTAAPTSSPRPTATPSPTPRPTASPTPPPTPAPTPTTAKLLFGLGSQAEGAREAAITKAAPIRILSSWYNGPNDLGWITDGWHRSIYQDAYAAGFSLHLITWTPEPETRFTASTGTVCGRAYPLSARWLDDMRQLARAFAGASSGPRLYVTLMTEFQTFPCIDNAWSPNAETTNYYKALIAQYEAAVRVFHEEAPNSRVSLGWGGWQADWDEPAIGGGRSLIPYFAGAMRASDFQSFQAMHGVTNVSRIRAMTSVLGAYGPVMLAHHMPDADTNALSTVYATFAADVETLFTPTSVKDLVDDGLFAWSFLDDKPMRASATTFALVDTAVTTFGR